MTKTATGESRRLSQFVQGLCFDDTARDGDRYPELVSEEAKKMFRAIAERYAAAGHPDRVTHHFDAGAMTDPHRELEAAGLIQRVFGVPGGVCWRLTEAGVEEVKRPS